MFTSSMADYTNPLHWCLFLDHEYIAFWTLLQNIQTYAWTSLFFLHIIHKIFMSKWFFLQIIQTYSWESVFLQLFKHIHEQVFFPTNYWNIFTRKCFFYNYSDIFMSKCFSYKLFKHVGEQMFLYFIKNK